MNETEIAFHNSFKPRWGGTSTLICATNDVKKSVPEGDDGHADKHRWEEGTSIVSEGRNIGFLKFGTGDEVCLFITDHELVCMVIDTNYYSSLPKHSTSRELRLTFNWWTMSPLHA
jgi:hypothetical protein